MKRRLSIIFGVLVIFLFTKTFSGNQVSLFPLRVGVVRSVSAPLAFGESQGLYASQGIDLTFIEHETGGHIFNALERGEIDVAQISSTVVVRQMLNDKDFVVLATSGEVIFHVVTRTGSGIQKTADLKGKKIGVVSDAVSFLYALDNQLSFAGLEIADVVPVPLSVQDLPQALVDGRVDAVVATEPHLSRVMSLVGDAILIDPHFGSSVGLEIVALRSFVEDKPEVIVRFLAGTDESLGEFAGGTDEVLDFTAQHLGVSHSVASLLAKNTLSHLRLDQSLVTLLENIAAWMASSGVSSPDVLAFLYFNALERVHPGAVTIVH